MARSRPASAQSVPVFRATDIVATDGANMGDTLSFAAELLLDDVYEISPDAAPLRLSLLPLSATHFRLGEATGAGTPGAEVYLDSALMFMSPNGHLNEALLLVEVDDEQNVSDVYLLPLSTLAARVEHRLVGIDIKTASQKFGQVACVSFTRGTHITLATGEQRLIENLNVGDKILTRDDGVQQVRWIGQSTVRAVGEFAPICIRAGTLNNEHDLIVSPDHRLFVYQRTDEVGAGRAELLIKARHLVNGETVLVQDGGFVDYFQLLFDSHQIIYAEGIAAESMLIDTRTRTILPADLSAAMGDIVPGHSDLPHAGLDVSEALLKRPDAAELLRKASGR
ncbi:Hint domain-containing protein [Sulfitobacter brevis]|uniref:Hint domain-containing protein n=1 Tax=Sulfitobacter brevis TaxID=74348 RepID=A0A1I2CDY8_9RHOB|nr:Hint domain-containing protein [Sulfitobacter brevis]SFE66521.1 Hint domain-containing protein [Sulfitobacter brevis]